MGNLIFYCWNQKKKSNIRKIEKFEKPEEKKQEKLQEKYKNENQCENKEKFEIYELF